MKKTSVILLCLISFTVIAKDITFKISSVYKKGLKITKANEVLVHATLNKEFTIPAGADSPFEFKLKASADAHNAVTLEGKISTLENNKLTLLASPKVITQLGKKATISTRQDDGTYFELTILPLTISETSKEIVKRSSSIKRLPVYTQSIFPVSYKPIEKVKSELEIALSKNGSIKIDPTTNSLIVKDTLKNMNKINTIFNSIDI